MNLDEDTFEPVHAAAQKCLISIGTFCNRFSIDFRKLSRLELKLYSAATPSSVMLVLCQATESLISSMTTFLLARDISNYTISDSTSYNKLEKELQRYEQKIREQVRIEQQLKLHSEMLQNKLEEVRKGKEILDESYRAKIDALLLANDCQEKTIKELRRKMTRVSADNNYQKSTDRISRQVKKSPIINARKKRDSSTLEIQTGRTSRPLMQVTNKNISKSKIKQILNYKAMKKQKLSLNRTYSKDNILEGSNAQKPTFKKGSFHLSSTVFSQVRSIAKNMKTQQKSVSRLKKSSRRLQKGDKPGELRYGSLDGTI